jgi:hypothetical protein
VNDTTLHHALECAARGWPVFPCQPGQKIPATRHGHLDATTDEQQITAWFGPDNDWNLAVATGAPGPDVLDIDTRGPAGNGFGALARLRAAGLLDGAAAYVRTPSGGLHAYFTGTRQRNGHLPAHHLDFRSAGGYVLVPPSVVGGRPYKTIQTPNGQGRLDWAAVTRLLEPDRQRSAARPLPGHGGGREEDAIGRLARWVGAQPEGNRNEGLFWAANRALEAYPAVDLSPLAAAARQAGLDEAEITRTLSSARRTARQARQDAPGRQAEGAS